MAQWDTVFEMKQKSRKSDPDRCLRVWRRQWYPNGPTGDGWHSRDGETLVAEGAAAQKFYDDAMHAYELSAQ